jgi:hypothetical protein
MSCRFHNGMIGYAQQPPRYENGVTREYFWLVECFCSYILVFCQIICLNKNTSLELVYLPLTQSSKLPWQSRTNFALALPKPDLPEAEIGIKILASTTTSM